MNIDKCISVSNDPFESNHKNTNVFFDKDPTLWIFNEMTHDHFVVHGFHQNKDVDLSKSKRQYSDQIRYLTH